MTVISKARPKAETTREAGSEDAAFQNYIDTLIADAVERRPPPLSPEEQRKKNQAAIEVLRQWRE
jgi:hypothetical protein